MKQTTRINGSQLHIKRNRYNPHRHSRATARKRSTQLAVLALAALAVINTLAKHAAAQGLLDGNAQQPITAVGTIINLIVWALIAGSIGSIAWGIKNGMGGKGWQNPIGWGGVGLGFGGFVAMVNTIVLGNPLTLPGL